MHDAATPGLHLRTTRVIGAGCKGQTRHGGEGVAGAVVVIAVGAEDRGVAERKPLLLDAGLNIPNRVIAIDLRVRSEAQRADAVAEAVVIMLLTKSTVDI